MYAANGVARGISIGRERKGEESQLMMALRFLVGGHHHPANDASDDDEDDDGS